MAPEELATRLCRQPFAPFRMTLTEGGTYEIRRHELCMVGRRSAIIDARCSFAGGPVRN